ncbi:MAG: hypothetical protein AAFV53_15225 [Myxococcota bacterium]
MRTRHLLFSLTLILLLGCTCGGCGMFEVTLRDDAGEIVGVGRDASSEVALTMACAEACSDDDVCMNACVQHERFTVKTASRPLLGVLHWLGNVVLRGLLDRLFR